MRRAIALVVGLSLGVVAAGCQPQRPVPPSAPPQSPPTPNYDTTPGTPGGRGADGGAADDSAPAGPLAPPPGAGTPVGPEGPIGPAGPVDPSELPASIGLPGRSPIESAAMGTALRFLDGLFRGIPWRWQSEVDPVAVFANWDSRDGRHPNPLRMYDVMRSRLLAVEIEGREAWLAASWADRQADMELRVRGDHAFAVWPHVRGRLAVPLARSAANRWVVWRMPFRPDERPLPW